MGALMDLAPPHIMVEAGAKSTAIKLFLAGKWKMASTGHASILREFREPGGALTLGGDACDPTYHFKNSFRVNIPCKEAWEVNREELLTPRGLIWYTDGSKTKTGTGAGIWGERPRAEIAMSLDPHVSILQAEVFAIWACAKLCLERNYRDKHIYICSDSKAALGSIRATIVRSMLVQDCTDMLERLANNNNRVNLIWVPGYAGIPGNEKANMLAREGARRPSPDTAYRIGVDRRTAKETVREWACTQTHLTWNSTQGIRHTKAMFKGPSTRLGKTVIRLDRNQLRLLVGLITGHWYTSKHFMHLGTGNEPRCPRCAEEDETPIHLIWRC
ncbi:uncharacterized protein LOC123988683 [Osmia bicornis bicornis]|uniref:uncharacterized protein LOC123988683 n=1 Tax=Osmia bicornis bicornis TaxID=1437191 RepID=UPI001EAEE01E|nr:uncharacterized protein LOC123988683 [Osmia bicornis bicornis]